MTYTDLRNIYTNKYGISAIAHVEQLGGDAEKIIRDLASRMSEDDGFLTSPMFPVDDASSVEKAIRGEIERLYFGKLSKHEAASILKALRLSFNLSINVCGQEYNDCTFMAAWNRVNAPEQLFIEEDYMQ